MNTSLRRLRRAAEPLTGLLGVLLLWQVASNHVANAVLVPSPGVVWHAFVAMLDSELPKDVAASLVHLAIGYGFGAGAGLCLALMAASSPWLDAVIDPFASTASVPPTTKRNPAPVFVG